MTKRFYLADETQTLALGKKLAFSLPAKAIIFLNGTLGAGKTTLVRGLLKAAGHQGSTKSPTYTIVEPYLIGERQFYHFDLYRLGDPEELEYMGIRDYLDEQAICLFEWPEQGKGLLPEPDLQIDLEYDDNARGVTLTAKDSSWAQLWLQSLQLEA